MHNYHSLTLDTLRSYFPQELVLLPSPQPASFAHRTDLLKIMLSDISIVGGHRISHQAFEAQASNGLGGNIDWPHSLITLPIEFVELWKRFITKIFIYTSSSLARRCLLVYTSAPGLTKRLIASGCDGPPLFRKTVTQTQQ